MTPTKAPTSSERGQLNACARSGQSQVCARAQELLPSVDEPIASAAPTPSSRIGAGLQPSPQRGAPVQPLPQSSLAQPASDTSAQRPPAERVAAPSAPPRTVVVPEFVEIIRERPAVAISVAAGSLVAAGLFLAFMVSARRRRRAEAALAEDAARGAYQSLTTSLVDTLSHELYTPLTPLKGYAGMLKRKQLPPEAIHQLADKLFGASQQLEHLFDMLVALADIQRGAPDPEQDIVDLDASIRSAIDWVGTTEHPISLTIEPALPAIRSNERLLALAVGALVDNAVKFSPAGDPVRIDVRSRETGGREFLDIRVSDRGIGMTAGQLRVAFDPFRQIDGSLSRQFGGLGVGLALADRVARSHRGRLLASTQVGKGSAFTISIPLIRAERGLPVAPRIEQPTG